MEPGKDIFSLCDQIRETSFALHGYLKSGHLEKVYENGLTHRLNKAGLQVEQQYPIDVRDEDGTIIGHFKADLFVENCLLVEVKACKEITNEHLAQILGYLRACNIEHGVLINFGAAKLWIKKLILSKPE